MTVRSPRHGVRFVLPRTSYGCGGHRTGRKRYSVLPLLRFPRGARCGRMGLKKEAAVGLFAAARCAWFFGAGRVLIVDEYDKERVPALSEAGLVNNVSAPKLLIVRSVVSRTVVRLRINFRPPAHGARWTSEASPASDADRDGATNSDFCLMQDSRDNSLVIQTSQHVEGGNDCKASLGVPNRFSYD